MIEDKDKEGKGSPVYFAAKLEMLDGNLCARLTDVFREGEESTANAVAGMAAKDAVTGMSEAVSPAFLVPASVVGVAIRAAKREIKPGDCTCIECNGSPCGALDCAKCRAVRREAFTWAILGGMLLPECALRGRLCSAVRSVLGLSWADSGCGGDDPELEKAMDYIERINQKEEE